jgi:hypothetical protein
VATGTIIGGTPTAQGTFTFTVQGTDWANVPIAPMTYQLAIGPPPALTVVLPASGSTLPSGTVGTSYVQGFFASGGVPPYAWSVISGKLPPGLGLASPTPGLGQRAHRHADDGRHVHLHDAGHRRTGRSRDPAVQPRPRHHQ